MRIIAEAGCNWHTIEEAKEFIRKSKELNLFATKFQLYSEEQIKDSKDYEFLKSIQLDIDMCKELFDYGKSVNQEVLFTPMFLKAVDWLEDININYYKIRHKDRDNYDLYNRITATNKPFFRSVGFLDYEISRIHINEITLSCVPKYPATLHDYRWTFPNFINNGISDHTPDLSFLKRALQYKWLDEYYWEKHVCLTKDCLEAKWSVSFDELQKVLKSGANR